MLALAGLLFVQYSIQHGWMGPAARCTVGALAGAAALCASWPLLSRGYRITSEAVTGAGVVLLFGSTWAARVLYEFVPFPVAFAALIVVTAACGALAVRRRSQVIAVFGVVGGFATPLLLSLGSDRPLGLFLYLLAVDGAVLALGRARRWNVITIIAAFATPIVFTVWIVTHYGEAQLPFALLFCGASALAFAFGGFVDGGLRSRVAPIMGALSPFCFALYFASTGHMQHHLLPVALLLAVLDVAAVWIALRLRLPGLLAAAAIGSVTTFAIWIAVTQLSASLSWEACGIALGLAALLHIGAELAVRRQASAANSYWDAAVIAILGLGACGVIAAARAEAATPPWALLASALGLSALIVRQARRGGRAPPLALATVGVAATFAAWMHVRASTDGYVLSDGAVAAVVVLLGLAMLAPLFALRVGAQRSWAAGAALAGCVALSFERAYVASLGSPSAELIVLASVALALFGLVAARELRLSFAFAAACLSTWLVQALCAFGLPHTVDASLLQVGLTLATAELPGE